MNDSTCPACNQVVKAKPRPRYDTLAEQQAAWYAERLATHNPPTEMTATVEQRG